MEPMKSDPQDFARLKERHAALERQRGKVEGTLEAANKQLEQLKAEARSQYGTDDLNTLRQKLVQMQEENLRKRAEYQKHLDEIESKLRKVQDEYGQIEAGARKNA